MRDRPLVLASEQSDSRQASLARELCYCFDDMRVRDGPNKSHIGHRPPVDHFGNLVHSGEISPLHKHQISHDLHLRRKVSGSAPSELLNNHQEDDQKGQQDIDKRSYIDSDTVCRASLTAAHLRTISPALNPLGQSSQGGRSRRFKPLTASSSDGLAVRED
jgi:hypothetical protein